MIFVNPMSLKCITNYISFTVIDEWDGPIFLAKTNFFDRMDKIKTTTKNVICQKTN